MKLFVVFLLLLTALPLAAGPEPEPAPAVVASTAWTAAFGYAAGAETIHVLAPYEMRHPPEYELKPSDIAVLSQADFVIYAGYERMAEKITIPKV